MSTTSPLPELSPNATSIPDDPGQTTRPRPMHPVVAFIIGLSIILGASLMNAGGLNLTKLDHSRQAALPKSSRRRDLLRPLWLLGMLLYMCVQSCLFLLACTNSTFPPSLSQLVGSTLALEFMRAEYVAPLGSTALIFNFLFASILIGTPVTSTDIYGTVIIVFGVIGIVLFGSINSGLENEMDIARLSALWARAGWLAFFLLMGVTLSVLYICTSQLDAVLSARSDLDLPSEPFAASGSGARQQPLGPVSYLGAVAFKYNAILAWIREWIEHWTAAKGDKQIAWTLGIGWACCGGGLAGGCLVFAKSGCVVLLIACRACLYNLAFLVSSSSQGVSATKILETKCVTSFAHGCV
jgi:magnesium transporter